jgi:amino acid transporter
MTGIILAFVLIFFAFIGFEDMANVAEEVRKPQKTIPRAIILSVVITGIIYILVSLSVIRILNWEELAASSDVIINCTFCYSQHSFNHTCCWCKNFVWNGKK